MSDLELPIAVFMLLLAAVMVTWAVTDEGCQKDAEAEFRRGWIAGIDYERQRREKP